MQKSNRGFSLTEMSIVVVIMAIIAGAALQGQSMLEGAKIRAIISETSEHKISLNGFMVKYDLPPGDFDESVAYWGATTSDGNGNGQIEFVNALGSPTYEGFRAWQHLSYAGMTKMPYLGTETTGSAVIETDIPKSKSGGGYFWEYGVFGFSDYNALILGRPVTAAAAATFNGILTPPQAHEIDTKIDDGEPFTGSVQARDGDGSTAETCLDPGADTTAETADDFYKISLGGKDCTLAFKISAP